MDLHSYLKLGNNNSCFGCTRLQLGHGDLLCLDYLLTTHPDLAVVVELGTGMGVTAMHLAIAMALRQGSFHMFDVTDRRISSVRSTWPHQHAHFHRGENVLGEFPNTMVASVLMNDPVLLFMDNGKKRDEFRLYAPLARPGSVIAVHDWGTEIALKHVSRIIQPRHKAIDLSFLSATMAAWEVQ